MSRKKVVLGLMILFAGLAIMADSCNSTPPQQITDQNNNEQAAHALHQSVPYPKLTFSAELHNQADRYKRLNNPSEVGYVYVIAYNLVYGPYQVIGKCSSTESLYSSPVSVSDNLGNGNTAITVPAPQPDGSYGQNENAIFCFLDDAAKTMIEFPAAAGMGWIWTEKPLTGMPTVPGTGVVANGH